MEAVKKQKIKKIANISVTVLLYVFLAVALLSLVLSLFSKDDSGDGTASLFGYQMRLIITDSMGPCDATDVSGYEIGSLPVRTMVFVETVPEDEAEKAEWYAALKVGDVLTFRYTYTTQVTITHRIIDIYAKESGGYVITLEGDNRDAENQLMQQVIDTSSDSYNYVIGKVTGSSALLGFLTYLLREPLALILIIIVPCAIIIVLEVMKIVGIFQTDKNKKQQEQEDEIEALKRQLAEAQSRIAQPELAPDEAQAPPAEEDCTAEDAVEDGEIASESADEIQVTEQEAAPGIAPADEAPQTEEKKEEE